MKIPEAIKSPYVLAAFAMGCLIGFYGAKGSGVWSEGGASLGDFSNTLQEGKSLEYRWTMRPTGGGDPVEGKLIQRATGRKRVIGGREFSEMEYSYEGVPMPSGTYFARATRETIEQTMALVAGSDAVNSAKMQITTLAQLPLEKGRKWSYLGPSQATVTRFSDYRDASGNVHKGAACVVVSLGSDVKSEFWLHPDVGVLAMKVFLPNLGGEMEWQYLGAGKG